MASKCQILFIGDSIIHQMFDKEVGVWKPEFCVLKAFRTLS